MSAAKPDEVNPFAPPTAVESRPAKQRRSDLELRNEYLGGILLASGCGILAAVFFLVSTRYPTSDFGEMTSLMSRWASLCLAMVSLMFVLITLRAAGTRVWRHLRILLGRR
ncbi:hypothetical protein Pla123a_46610 [Posidoniimonas polymericola]|uniref:Uncharacterized protein n=1 Tax=Posidoniimonas polymericola TaxID=2528002 RepID=A0A5C5XZ57_9BACT|nr:hypothetical protein [Posidoniimonas polymericola]TWT66772.1 hypothetical protein Pla123a_46610 [Posidoniimonas polymericola]